MPWFDRYKEASFRGVKFNARVSRVSAGRRNTFYDIPFDESGGSVLRDLGKTARTFKLEVIIVGSNYDTTRDDLLDAFEQPGAGTLIHPYLGKVRVALDNSSPPEITESTEDGGMASVGVTFRKVREKKTPSIGVDSLTSLTQAVDTALEALNTDFVNTFNVDGVQEFVRDANLDVISDLTDEIADINRTIDSVLSIPSGIASDISLLSDELVDLINTPQQLVNTIQGVIASVFGSILRVGDAIGSLFDSTSKVDSVDSAILPVSSRDTPDRKTQKRNQDALIRMVKGSLLVGTATAAATLSTTTEDSGLSAFKSSDEALEYRNLFASLMQNFLEQDEMDSDAVLTDDLLEPVAPSIDDTYQALRSVLVALNQHMNQVVGDLPAVTLYNPPETVPSFVLAYRLYEDADRDLEIVDRNEALIDHPLFVPGKVDIEVISNV